MNDFFYHFRKTLMVLIVFFVILLQSHFMHKTRDGKFFQNYEYLPTAQLPLIMREYMYQNQIRYSYYKMPNYVIDFLKYDKEFGIAYNSGKIMIVCFSMYKLKTNNNQLTFFYQALGDLIKNYNDKYIYIIREEVTPPHYTLSFDTYGYKDLRDYCKNFCLINPKDNTMFVLSQITDSETTALELILQQFSLGF